MCIFTLENIYTKDYPSLLVLLPYVAHYRLITSRLGAMECHHLAFGFIFHCKFYSQRNNHIWLTFRWLHWMISAINLWVNVINGIGSKTWPMVTRWGYNRTSPCGHPPKRQTKFNLTWPFVPVQVWVCWKFCRSMTFCSVNLVTSRTHHFIDVKMHQKQQMGCWVIGKTQLSRDYGF